MMAASTWIMSLMILLGGGGNDLLDMVSHEAYWKSRGMEATTENLLAELKQVKGGDASALIKQLGAKQYKDRQEASLRLEAMGTSILPQLRKAVKSSDAEISIRAQRLIKKLSNKARGRSVRRLMAIRTLGELKDREAVPALRGLLKSKVLFEAEYAARAIAKIEGKPFKRQAVSAREMQSDLWLLPGNCGAVGQATLKPGKVISAKEILKPLLPAMPAMRPGNNAEKTLAKINKMLITAAERFGNARLSGITIGVGDGTGGEDADGKDTGYVVIVFRGLYDCSAMREAILEQKEIKTEKVGRTEIIIINGNAAIIPASNERFILIAGPSRKQMPIEQMVAALKTGKGKLGGNKAIAALVKSVDTTSPVWAVMQVSKAYRKASFLEPFQSLALVGKRKAGQMDFVLKARGADAEKVAKAVEEFNNLMAEGRKETAEMAEHMPAFKPIVDFITTIKAAANGTNATATARLKGDMKTLLSIPVSFFMAMSGTIEFEGGAEMMPQGVVVEEEDVEVVAPVAP